MTHGHCSSDFRDFGAESTQKPTICFSFSQPFFMYWMVSRGLVQRSISRLHDMVAHEPEQVFICGQAQWLDGATEIPRRMPSLPSRECGALGLFAATRP